MQGHLVRAGGVTQVITMTDLNYGGCGIMVPVELAPGEEVKVSVLGRGSIAAEVCWYADGRAGLVFEPVAQETVTGMNGLGASGPCCLDDLIAKEIALACGTGTDAHGFISHPDMQRLGVRIGIDRDRANSEPPRGSDDTAGDLAPVCNEKRFDHWAGHPAVRSDQLTFAIFQVPLSRTRSK
jgi:hypothetical protein